jgi:hypothetical protein
MWHHGGKCHADTSFVAPLFLFLQAQTVFGMPYREYTVEVTDQNQ